MGHVPHSCLVETQQNRKQLVPPIPGPSLKRSWVDVRLGSVKSCNLNVKPFFP